MSPIRRMLAVSAALEAAAASIGPGPKTAKLAETAKRSLFLVRYSKIGVRFSHQN